MLRTFPLTENEELTYLIGNLESFFFNYDYLSSTVPLTFLATVISQHREAPSTSNACSVRAGVEALVERATADLASTQLQSLPASLPVPLRNEVCL